MLYAFIIAVFIACSGDSCYSSDLLTTDTIAKIGNRSQYEWRKAANKGSGCFPPNCRNDQFPMAIKPVAAFDGMLYSVGADRIWTSRTGLDWASEKKTDWGERHGMQFAYFRGKLWMTGGMSTWADFRNDIWSTVDGTNWRRTVTNAEWGPRRNHSVLVHRDKLWIIGGGISSGRADQTPVAFHQDVWTSEDGVTWECVSASVPWQVDWNQTAVSFKDQIIVVDSTGGGVWSSTDGAQWKRLAADQAWKGRGGHGVVVFDDRLWIFGGVDRNDVWSSPNGSDWKLEFGQAPWSTRSTTYSVAFRDRLWIFSGKTGRVSDSWEGDIWVMVGKRSRIDVILEQWRASL